MKKFSTLFGVLIVATLFSLTSSAQSYTITLISKETVGSNQQWTWSLKNPVPGNGDNGTLQDVSHWSIDLPPSAEVALVSAEYSNDGINWQSVTTTIDRDPSLKCSWLDVLKFDKGTIGTQPTYYRCTFNRVFEGTTMAMSFIKTGGGRQGCNMAFFLGIQEPNSGGSY